MPRAPGPAAQDLPDTVDHAAVAADSAALTLLGARAAEVAQRYGDGQPYDRARVVGEARFYMSQSAEAMLEAGKRLVQIKENEGHGDFQEIVEHSLGLNTRTAQKMMQAAIKYLRPAIAAKASAPALLGLGKAKLFELMTEDDEDLVELSDGGTVAGLHLDDMQAMTSRELRAALVEARKRTADKDRVIANKDAKLNELAEAEERRRSASRNEAESQHLLELRDATLAAEQALDLLLSKLDEVLNNPPTEACGLAARQTLDYVVQRLVDAADQRGLALDIEERVTPLQMQAMREAVVAAQQAGRAKARG